MSLASCMTGISNELLTQVSYI